MNLDKPLVKKEIVRAIKGTTFRGNKKQLEKSFDKSIKRFTKGKSITVYHGSNRSFKNFSLKKSRSDANASFQGDGIFFTTDKTVAKKYATASRNANFDKDILRELKKSNSDIGKFAQELYDKGTDAWSNVDLIKKLDKMGIDPNDISDLTEWIAGSKNLLPNGGGTTMEMFSTKTISVPNHIIDIAQKFGVKDNLLFPKVYTTRITGENILVTSIQSEVRTAFKKGYDAVVYTGSGTVDDIAEIIIYNPDAIKIIKSERI